jgi:lipopolysaccharide transport system ATP-binding protein
MVVRLAFAVQAMVGPDILVVDEALAVGDVRFQAKCFDRLKQLKERGTSILLVTHSGEQIVTHCNRAVLLDEGCIVELGEPKQVVNRYMDLLFGKEKKESPAEPVAVVKEPGENALLSNDLNSVQDVFSTRPGYNPHEYRWGDGAAAILDFYLAVDGTAYPTSVASGQQVTLALSVRFLEELVRPILGVTIKNKEGVTVYGVNSETLALDEFKNYGKQGSVVSATVQFICRLARGDYFFSLGIATRQGEEIVPHDRRYDAIHLQVRSDGSFFGLIDLQCKLSTQQTDVS